VSELRVADSSPHTLWLRPRRPLGISGVGAPVVLSPEVPSGDRLWPPVTAPTPCNFVFADFHRLFAGLPLALLFTRIEWMTGTVGLARIGLSELPDDSPLVTTEEGAGAMRVRAPRLQLRQDSWPPTLLQID